jgi:hypothetical protein
MVTRDDKLCELIRAIYLYGPFSSKLTLEQRELLDRVVRGG